VVNTPFGCLFLILEMYVRELKRLAVFYNGNIFQSLTNDVVQDMVNLSLLFVTDNPNK
jgi:hypothetical protein